MEKDASWQREGNEELISVVLIEIHVPTPAPFINGLYEPWTSIKSLNCLAHSMNSLMNGACHESVQTLHPNYCRCNLSQRGSMSGFNELHMWRSERELSRAIYSQILPHRDSAQHRWNSVLPEHFRDSRKDLLNNVRHEFCFRSNWELWDFLKFVDLKWTFARSWINFCSSTNITGDLSISPALCVEAKTRRARSNLSLRWDSEKNQDFLSTKPVGNYKFSSCVLWKRRRRKIRRKVFLRFDERFQRTIC